LKILRLITRLNIGGPAIHAVTLSAELPTEEFSTTLVCGLPGDTEGDMTPLAETKGVRTVCIPSLRREIHPAGDLRSLAAIVRLLRREKTDILHTHMSKAGALGRIAARFARGVKTVHTFHGNVLRGYFSSARASVYLLAERWLAERTDALVALSESQRKEMLERYGVGRAEQYTVIPLGLDLGRFARCEGQRGALRSELGITGGTPVVAIVGRLVPIKDHRLFLGAARRVLDDLPDAVFLIVGGGELRAELEARARRVGLGRSAMFLGWRSDLERIYADSDVVVLTSINEGTPVSLIEAGAAGKPVVATDAGGVSDVVRNGESGLIAGSRDPAEFARLVVELLRDSARRAAMGNAGRKYVMSRYAKERLLRDIAALYEDLAGRRG
jgi:glycosyltransferase involved in cell wall biosynthesis